jgi:DNA transformation protein and related proteins
MFGGVGIYGGELFFALIDDDTLYFKVDESTRPEFEARGMGPFQPYGEEGETMGYYRVPEDLLEDECSANGLRRRSMWHGGPSAAPRAEYRSSAR